MQVSIEELKTELKKQVTEHRYIHSIGVAESAKKLAEKYGADKTKAEIAGILHDYTKFWPKEELARIIKDHHELPDDLLEYSAELWHGPVASIVVQDKFAITDQEIIMSIKYHTSGRVGMSLLEKIICLADYIEPSRHFPGVDQIRELAETDLENALIKALDGTIQFLIKQKQTIYPLTVNARNDLIIKSKKGGYIKWD